MNRTEKVKSLQRILEVSDDGIWGPKTQAALDDLIRPLHHVIATSFADPADVLAFRKCKLQGKTDQECFKVGDNGIGCWGDDTTDNFPMCALPPEDMEERWGSVNGAKHKYVRVEARGNVVICRLSDRMPRRANIKNGAGLDLNPSACKSLGLTPPIKVQAAWRWV